MDEKDKQRFDILTVNETLKLYEIRGKMAFFEHE